MFQLPIHYILEDGEPVAVRVWSAAGEMDRDALLRWAAWYEDPENRRVALTHLAILPGLPGLPGSVRVSTIFIGIDHSLGLSEPLLFETMIFGGELDRQVERYTTLDDARAGHEHIVGLASHQVRWRRRMAFHAAAVLTNILIAAARWRLARCSGTDRLEFHHKAGHKKVANVSRLWTMRAELVWKEIDKCELLCHECHFEVTYYSDTQKGNV